MGEGEKSQETAVSNLVGFGTNRDVDDELARVWRRTAPPGHHPNSCTASVPSVPGVSDAPRAARGRAKHAPWTAWPS